ncbi:MAG: hypothetical protein IPL46_33355 [Saprospiraceae bacterium]|nr:hypothetical protein [Saprospiraceae bacterium]
MKRLLGFFVITLLTGLVLQSFTGSSAEATFDDAGPSVKFPKKVDAVIKNKCYGCHSAEGKSDKAKAALMWDDLAGLQPSMQAEKLKNISKVLSEGAMPPKMFVEKMPEKKLTAVESALMSKWAEKTAKKVAKKLM